MPRVPLRAAAAPRRSPAIAATSHRRYEKKEECRSRESDGAAQCSLLTSLPKHQRSAHNRQRNQEVCDLQKQQEGYGATGQNRLCHPSAWRRVLCRRLTTLQHEDCEERVPIPVVNHPVRGQAGVSPITKGAAASSARKPG
jgi:ribosomal protein L32E